MLAFLYDFLILYTMFRILDIISLLNSLLEYALIIKFGFSPHWIALKYGSSFLKTFFTNPFFQSVKLVDVERLLFKIHNYRVIVYLCFWPGLDNDYNIWLYFQVKYFINLFLFVVKERQFHPIMVISSELILVDLKIFQFTFDFL